MKILPLFIIPHVVPCLLNFIYFTVVALFHKINLVWGLGYSAKKIAKLLSYKNYDYQ